MLRMATRKARKKSATDEAEPEATPAFPVVGIGGSAGGIEAFTALLKAMPDKPLLALVFILHQDPKYASNLDQILERATKLPVEVVRAGTAVRPGHAYVAPPGSEVAIEHGVLQLHKAPKAMPPSTIDAFFRSLAADQGSRAISVVLSGSASDGSLGTKAIKAEGGITFAQDDTAKMSSMPRSAVASGYVDFVLPPEEIAKELARIAQHVYIVDDGIKARLPEQDVVRLLNVIRAKHNIDFTYYKPSTIERRIRRRMALRRVSSLRDYLPLVRDDPKEAEALYGDILIRVTGFFRDADVFEALARKVFPDVIRERREEDTVRVWVPGCATGEEVYSLAIALLEAAATSASSCPIQIFGTDVSEQAIERARAGLYPESISGEVSSERLRRFFNRLDSGYRVSKAVRDCCIFARQNVANDPPFSKLDLISCRNVMIYFGSALQRKVVSIFHYALRTNGYLLLGSSETIGNFADLFAVVDRKNKIYRKKTITPRPQTDFVMPSPLPVTPDEEPAPERESLKPSAIVRDADRVLLNRFSPVGVLINENLDVLQFRGRTSPYLEIPPGTASFNLLKMAREGLLADLRAAIFGARKKQAAERRTGVHVRTNGSVATVDIEVIPFVSGGSERFLLVLFEENERSTEKKARSRQTKETTREARGGQISRLKRELEATREYLQSIIEEQEAMNEELRSANEEIQSSNEELQSTNEELETAKEELQSSNEELTTLNEELENRNRELAHVSSDFVNLLVSIEIPILMLDSGLRIRRFNPGAQQIFNLIPSDVGRPIGDMKTTIDVDVLRKMVTDVIDALEVREGIIQDKTGRKFSLRVRPYRTTDNKIDGAVLAFINLEEFPKSSAR